jgi:hypothetical protein
MRGETSSISAATDTRRAVGVIAHRIGVRRCRVQTGRPWRRAYDVRNGARDCLRLRETSLLSG